MSKHIKLKIKIRKPYLTLLKSIEWLEKDWLVYGEGLGVREGKGLEEGKGVEEGKWVEEGV